MNILVAVDLSEASDRVIEAARGVADLTGASIYVLHVVEAEADINEYDSNPQTMQKRIASDFPKEHKGVLALVQKLQDEAVDARPWLGVPESPRR